jgi:hypothetical protein
MTVFLEFIRALEMMRLRETGTVAANSCAMTKEKSNRGLALQQRRNNLSPTIGFWLHSAMRMPCLVDKDIFCSIMELRDIVDEPKTN